MANTVDLLVRVLADTSQANASFSGMSSNITRALGIGAAGGAAVAVTEAAVSYQSAMARIQAAYNNTDFGPGTQKFSDAKDQILKDSVTLATSFSDVADVYGQAARFVDDFGNKLPTDKVNEYVDTVVRLGKVSTDALAPTDIGQRLDVFEKLFGQTNFGAVGSAISAESGIHNQGEGPMLDTSIAIAQYGASMGVSQAQALGIGNYLTDLKAGGQQGGSSFGRILQRMDSSADTVLDPQTTVANAKKSREAQDRLDDLQTSLKEAEASQSQMYGQHGLKTAYKRNPEAVMASEDRIAKLNRDIAEAKSDQLADATTGGGTARGQMNVSAMARTAGQEPEAFAQLFKENPAQALLDFTRGLHDLPEQQRAAAEKAAGIVNVRDVKTINTLADRPDVISDYISRAQAQLDNPTDLQQRSDVVLGTTASKQQDVVNAATGAAAIVGEPMREVLDQGLTGILAGIQQDGFAPLEASMGQLDVGLGLAAGAATLFAQQLGVAGSIQLALAGGGLLKAGGGLLAGRGGAGGGGPELPPDWTSADLERIRNGGLGQAPATGAASATTFGTIGAAGGVVAAALGQAVLSDKIADYLTGMGVPEAVANGVRGIAAPGAAEAVSGAKNIQHYGDIIINNRGDIEAQAEAYKQMVVGWLTSAWTAAATHTPVSGALGGNIGGASP